MTFSEYPENGWIDHSKNYLGIAALILVGLLVTFFLGTILQLRADARGDRAAATQVGRVVEHTETPAGVSLNNRP